MDCRGNARNNLDPKAARAYQTANCGDGRPGAKPDNLNGGVCQMLRIVAGPMVTLAVLCLVGAVLGCSGEALTGSARGYVYVLSPGAPTAMQTLPPIVISTSPTPPPGYEPAVGAVVTIGASTVITNSLGFYVLVGLPPGTYNLEVDLDDDGVVDIAVEIVIIAGQTTEGTDHTEGGS